MSRQPVWENMKVWMGPTWCMAAKRADSSEATCSTWFSWHVSTSPGEVSTFRSCNQIQSSAWTQSRCTGPVNVSDPVQVSRLSQVSDPVTVLGGSVGAQTLLVFQTQSSARPSHSVQTPSKCSDPAKCSDPDRTSMRTPHIHTQISHLSCSGRR